MSDLGLSPQSLVYIAGGCYVLGLIVINQMVLRLFLLAGTSFYIVYYFTVSAAPLWEAIYISGLIGMANVIGLISLIARRSTLAVPAAHADIFSLFPSLPPGDFRALMKLARRYRVTDRTQVTTEGDTGTMLYYIIAGEIQVLKGGDRFLLPPGIFLGEVAYLIGVPSSASTWLEPGTELLEWRFAHLRRRSERDARFKLALDAALSADLARKVAIAVAPGTPEWRPERLRAERTDQLAEA